MNIYFFRSKNGEKVLYVRHVNRLIASPFHTNAQSHGNNGLFRHNIPSSSKSDSLSDSMRLLKHFD